MLNIDLTGRIALVLGGSRGIGASITRCLCEAGATTIFTHTGKAKHKQRVKNFIENIEKSGGTVQGQVVDACDSKQTTQMVDRIVDEHGRIDILVPNIGQNLARPAEQIIDEDWRHFVDINLTSAFYGVRAVLPHMIKAKYGRIILIGSSAVYDGGGGAIDYAAAKAGLEGMMVYLVRTYGRKGISTNLIHPCLIETELLHERYCSEEALAQLSGQTLVGRLGKPEDIAGLVAYLASSWGDYVCGQSILLDGGRVVFGQKT